MAEFSAGCLRLQLRGKNQNQGTYNSTKTWLNVFNEWKEQRNEARKLKETPCHELRKTAFLSNAQ